MTIKSLIVERESITVEKERISIGQIVSLETFYDNNPEDNDLLIIKISSYKDDDGDYKRISPSTPLAKAILGKSVDDKVRIECVDPEDSYSVVITAIDNNERD